jgi:putative chitobiose transport system substrate-binding protein
MIKTRWSQRLGKVIVFSMLVGGITSCTPDAPANPELEFWTMQLQPKFTPYFNDLIATFEQDNPEIDIRWIDVPWSAMESKVLTVVSAKNPPDVVNLNPNFASKLATRNAWLDLNAEVPPEVKQRYLPKIWQASTVNETSFGLPWYLTTRVTIYNQDLLTSARVNTPPRTFNELAEVAKKVKEETGKYAFFVTFVPGDSGEVLESLVQMGVELVNEEGKAGFNTPAGKAAFQYWVDLYQNDLLPPEALTQGHRYAIELYQAGETALLSSGAEFLETIANNAPTVAEVSAAAPQITGETGKKNVAVMNLVVPRDSEYPEQGLDFALFVTNTENQLAFAKAANVLPSTQEAVQQYIKDLEGQGEATPVEQARKISAMQLQDAEVLVPARENLNQLQTIIYENLQAAMLGQKTVDEAIRDAEVAWNAVE